ncbi:MAG: hypothetical protein MI725_15445 [Pirellulales bacterium]|nr:hypothetical protein [Pirellulales bacterium]
MHSTTQSRVILLLVFVCFSMFRASALADDEKYTLQYKFKMGEVLRYGVKHTANIRSTIEGTSQDAESKSESIKAWKVTDALPDGEMEFVHVVEAVRMSNRVPNRAETVYDSESDDSPPPGFEQAARAVGVPLSVIRIKPSGEIVHREEKHPQPPASEDMPITLQLPDEPIAVGEQWDATYDVSAERKSGGKLQVRTRRVCTLQDVEDDIARILVDYQILTPVSPYVESQLIERLTKGTVHFDLQRGRVVSQKFEADRRVLGFAGEASSMHYVSTLEERLLKPGERLAQRKKTDDENAHNPQ